MGALHFTLKVVGKNTYVLVQYTSQQYSGHPLIIYISWIVIELIL